MDFTNVHDLSGQELLDFVAVLSAMPAHPYEQLKYQYFDSDYQFPTIHDVELPEDFCIKACTQSLSSIHEDMKYTHLDHFDYLHECHLHPNLGHGFAVLSGDQFVVDHNKAKKYIEFHEISNSVPVETLTPENSVEIAHKLIHAYTQIYS